MPQTVTLFRDLGPKKKGIAKKGTPCVYKEDDFVLFNCNSSLGLLSLYCGHRSLYGRPWDPLLFVCMAMHSTLPRAKGNVPSSDFPLQMRQSPGGCLFLQGHSLWKWPPCPHWKQVPGFGPELRVATLRTVISNPCHISFFFFRQM
jgi:hypothetical protein